MSEFKHSRFNYVFDFEGNKHIYNPFAGIFKLSDELYKSYERLIPCATLDFLLEKGIVVKDTLDENKRLTFLRNKQIYSNVLDLQILPSYRCNMSCDYCFVKKNGSVMTETTKKDILIFIDKMLKTGIKVIKVTWFGGEPLLEYEIIRDLSSRMIDLCAYHGAKYQSFLITNGTLINEAIVDSFEELGIIGLQITMDGAEYTHNKYRVLNNGLKSFDLILRNLMLFRKVKPNIRVNITRNNSGGIETLLQDLFPYKQYINAIDILPLFKVDGMSKEQMECLYSDKDFAMVEIELLKLVYKYGFKTNGSLMYNLIGSPSEIPYYFAVDPQGRVYKDEYLLGDDEGAIGHIKDLNPYSMSLNEKYLDYVLSGPLENKECLGCKVLPLCMGRGQFYMENSCSTFKYTLEEQLKLYLQRGIDNEQRR